MRGAVTAAPRLRTLVYSFTLVYILSFTSRLPLSSLPFRRLPSFTVTASFSYRSFTEHKRPRYQAAILVYRPRYPPRLVTVVKVPGLVTARLLSSSVRYRLVTGTQPWPWLAPDAFSFCLWA